MEGLPLLFALLMLKSIQVPEGSQWNSFILTLTLTSLQGAEGSQWSQVALNLSSVPESAKDQLAVKSTVQIQEVGA